MPRRFVRPLGLVAMIAAAALVAHAQQQEPADQPAAAQQQQPAPTPQPQPQPQVIPATPMQVYQQYQLLPEDGWPTAAANPFSRLPPRPAKLAAGDLVVLTMYGLVAHGVATPFYLHVDDSGALSVPLVGLVDVKDMTTDRAASRVSKAMADQQIARDAIVTVGLLQTAAETGVATGPFKPGDPVQVTVFDLVGTGRRLVSLAMVGDDGEIDLPLAGMVKLEGLTEPEADKAVQNRYRERRLLPNGTISVLKLAAGKD